MPKYVGYFLFGVVFVMGLSFGSYMALEQKKNDAVEDETKNITPIQDVVIRNVQEEKIEKEPTKIETVIEETKLSPYAKMIIEKKFTKCGHTTIETVDLPMDLINMTEADILKKYENWEIKSFSPKEVSLYREINANCNDHFVLKEKDGFLAIYNDLKEETMNLKEVTDIDISNLPLEELEKLQLGIYLYRSRQAIKRIRRL